MVGTTPDAPKTIWPSQRSGGAPRPVGGMIDGGAALYRPGVRSGINCLSVGMTLNLACVTGLPGLAGKLGRVLLVQADEQVDQFAAHRVPGRCPAPAVSIGAVSEQGADLARGRPPRRVQRGAPGLSGIFLGMAWSGYVSVVHRMRPGPMMGQVAVASGGVSCSLQQDGS